MIVLLDRLIGVRGQGEKIALEMGFEDSQEVSEANSRVSVTEADIHGRRTRRKRFKIKIPHLLLYIIPNQYKTSNSQKEAILCLFASPDGSIGWNAYCSYP